MARAKVLLALITEDNDYQREQAGSARAVAQRLGIDLEVVWAESDVVRQTRQITAAIHDAANRPAVVLVEPVRSSLDQVARMAVRNGVGWLLLGRESRELAALRGSSTLPIGSVFNDNAEIGRLQGRQLAALLPGGGTVLYVEGLLGDVAKERRGGVAETLPRRIELVSVRGDWTEESGAAALQGRLRLEGARPPSVQAIACQNDAMARGARRALEALPPGPRRDQWLRLPITGVDGLPGTGRKWVRDGWLTATVITPPPAALALELVAGALAAGGQLGARPVTSFVSLPPIEQLTPVAARAAS